MFVCLERMRAPCFSLIGLTSDVVCVRVYYTDCVVISNPEPKHPPPPPPPPPPRSHRHDTLPQPQSHPSPLLHLPEGLLSPHAISQHPTHAELSCAHSHTHICLGSCLQTVISHVSIAQWWNAWGKPFLHPSTPHTPPSLSAHIFWAWRGHLRQGAYNQLN